MARTYFDASVLMKMVHAEPGSIEAKRLWERADPPFGSHLVTVELASAIAASLRDRRVTKGEHRRIVSEAAGHGAALVAVNLTEEIAERAAVLAARHALKGADAVHLATALWLEMDDLVFATWDRRLHRAAGDAGLLVAPASI